MRRTSGERGETLLESLISVLVVAVGIVGLLTSLGSGVSLSAAHSEQSRADLLLRNAVERWDSSAYVTGATQAQVQVLLATAAPVDGLVLAVSRPRCWSGGPPDPTSAVSFPDCTVLNDRGLQLLTLTVSNAGGRQLQTMDALKRCSGSTCPVGSYS